MQLVVTVCMICSRQQLGKAAKTAVPNTQLILQRRNTNGQMGSANIHQTHGMLAVGSILCTPQDW